MSDRDIIAEMARVGGPAFPVEGGDLSPLYAHYGMSLRDWFAGVAMQRDRQGRLRTRRRDARREK